ncbi:hypothetical protein [Xylanibacter rodentium]|uniref:hypothetical protein n=1 Tax=Xylanibacter rodentium TaxID=2736289 RepID=UPI00258A0CD3|nr:hypothetical protein [Xylanibacter rodentium]
MRQPDTSALRERLNSYTPGQELEEDKQELEGLLLKVNCQITELRNLLKGINDLKEELHGIHDSLRHTAKRERAAFNALNAAKDSADNIVNGICNAIVKAERHTVIHATVGTDELAKVNQCSAAHIKAEEELLERHRNKLAVHLRNSEGIWLSNHWMNILLVVHAICVIAIFLWVYCRWL